MAYSKEFKEKEELEAIRHKNRMLEIKTECDGKKEVEKLKFDSQMSLHRIKRADIRNTIETKRQYRESER